MRLFIKRDFTETGRFSKESSLKKENDSQTKKSTDQSNESENNPKEDKHPFDINLSVSDKGSIPSIKTVSVPNDSFFTKKYDGIASISEYFLDEHQLLISQNVVDMGKVIYKTRCMMIMTIQKIEGIFYISFVI